MRVNGMRSAPKRSLLKSKKSRLSDSEAVHLDRLLDEALRETFPASDPIAITIDRPSKAIAAELLQSADDPHRRRRMNPSRYYTGEFL
jgi:hypothetical protein